MIKKTQIEVKTRDQWKKIYNFKFEKADIK